MELKGLLSYRVKLSNSGSIVRKHVDQIRARVEVETFDESNEFPELHREVIPEVIVEGPDAGEEASGEKKQILTTPTILESNSDKRIIPPTELLSQMPQRMNQGLCHTFQISVKMINCVFKRAE